MGTDLRLVRGLGMGLEILAPVVCPLPGMKLGSRMITCEGNTWTIQKMIIGEGAGLTDQCRLIGPTEIVEGIAL